MFQLLLVTRGGSPILCTDRLYKHDPCRIDHAEPRANDPLFPIRQRQSRIDEELFDVVSGFEALSIEKTG